METNNQNPAGTEYTNENVAGPVILSGTDNDREKEDTTYRNDNEHKGEKEREWHKLRKRMYVKRPVFTTAWHY